MKASFKKKLLTLTIILVNDLVLRSTFFLKKFDDDDSTPEKLCVKNKKKIW